MNHLPTVGIIGGAGPEAGALLFRQMIQICQDDYGCSRDHDFPLFQLISYPFSEMLQGNIDAAQILTELKWAYNKLDTDFIVIACNTAHSFLDDSFAPPRFHHLIEETASMLNDTPLLLCSSTSRSMKIHERVFPCEYPDNQQEVDDIIDAALANDCKEALGKRLEKIIAQSQRREIVLGCTELSLLKDNIPLDGKGKTIIDPSMIVAKKIISKVFTPSGVKNVNGR